MAVTTTITAVILLPVGAGLGRSALLPETALGWWKLLGLAWISHAAGRD